MIKITIELDAMTDPIIQHWMSKLIKDPKNPKHIQKVIAEILDRKTLRMHTLESISGMEYEPPIPGLYEGGHLPKKDPVLNIGISG